MWKGRFDSSEKNDLRLWQIINTKDRESSTKGYVITGYNTDDGVTRNLGRDGAKDGSSQIRKSMSSLPYISKMGDIFDNGNLDIDLLEEAQIALSNCTKDALSDNLFPINLGGGHDIAYGTYLGVRNHFKDKVIGIINFDAHLDMRSYENKPTSGTMFKQILDNDKNARYMIIGYQSLGNTLRLRELAKEKGVVIANVLDEYNDIKNKMDNFISNCDVIYTTFCMDVFDITEAPGVSAPSSIGLEKKLAMKLFSEIIDSKKICALDFAEVNPNLDIDNRTSRLVGNFIYKLIEKRS